MAHENQHRLMSAVLMTEKKVKWANKTVFLLLVQNYQVHSIVTTD